MIKIMLIDTAGLFVSQCEGLGDFFFTVSPYFILQMVCLQWLLPQQLVRTMQSLKLPSFLK